MHYCQIVWRGGEYHDVHFDIVITFMSKIGFEQANIKQFSLQENKAMVKYVNELDHEITGSNGLNYLMS